ncbi:hypothetical protein IFM89_030471, partial [Coptis chinensis]
VLKGVILIRGEGLLVSFSKGSQQIITIRVEKESLCHESIIRVLGVADVSGDVAGECITSLTSILGEPFRLFPIIQDILANDVTEFWPYAFQLLAQLVELSRPPIHQNYKQVFEVLLSPELWKRYANGPALVRLLQAYLRS